MPGGRPSKLTTELTEKLCALLADGKPIKPSCEMVGIDQTTFYKWKVAARKGDRTAQEFFGNVARARAEGELHLWEIAASGDGVGTSNGPAKCAQWLLERTFGGTYQARLNVKLEEGLEAFIEHAERICGAKDCGCFEEILAAVAASRTGGEEAGDDPAVEDRATVH